MQSGHQPELLLPYSWELTVVKCSLSSQYFRKMDLDSSSAKPPEKAEACVANVAPKASAPSPEPVPGESLGPAKCRTPIASAKTPVLYRKTPWNVTPRSTATTPYAKSFLAMRSPKVAEVLREADTARFEARYHLKVAELRKANEAIKKLTAEVAEAAVLKQSLAEKEEELKESRKELRDSKQRTEELQVSYYFLCNGKHDSENANPSSKKLGLGTLPSQANLRSAGQ